MINGFDFYLKDNNIITFRSNRNDFDNLTFHSLINTLDLIQTDLLDCLSKKELENDFYFVIYYSNKSAMVKMTIDDNGKYYFIINGVTIVYSCIDEYISLNF